VRDGEVDVLGDRRRRVGVVVRLVGDGRAAPSTAARAEVRQVVPRRYAVADFDLTGLVDEDFDADLSVFENRILRLPIGRDVVPESQPVGHVRHYAPPWLAAMGAYCVPHVICGTPAGCAIASMSRRMRMTASSARSTLGAT
jgi:hypothetical protein